MMDIPPIPMPRDARPQPVQQQPAAPDLARIKRNVAKMVAMQAPEADIDGYIQSEGVTVDDVRNFRATADAPPTGAEPGSREYADWALQQARAGKKLPQVSEKPPEVTDTYHDLGGKALAAGGSFIEGVPVAGPTLLDWAQQARGAIHGMSPEQVQTEFAAVKEANPITSTVGNVAGSVATLAPLGTTAVGGRLLGTVGSLGERLAASTLSGAGISGADTLARGGSIEDAGRNALIGGAVGAAFPAVGAIKNSIANRTAQRVATNAAIKGAPSAAELSAQGAQIFKAVDDAGISVSTPKFSELVQNLVYRAKKARINPNLDPKAWGAFEEMIGALDDVQRNGGALTFSDLHTLRQIAQKAAVSAEGRDSTFANMIVQGLDDFVTAPGVAAYPANRIGQAAGGAQLKEAISTWARAQKVSLVEEAMYKASNQASGIENGLRVQFRQLLNNKKTRALFTQAELHAIQDVVRGNAVSNIAKLAGMFGFNIGGSGGANIVGGSLGLLFGGPVGAAVGAGARKVSEKLTERAAERAAKVVATPNVPVVPRRPIPPALLPPATIPVVATQRREPIPPSGR